MRADRKTRNHRVGPDRFGPGDESQTADDPREMHETREAGEGTENLGRIARSIGFSSREAVEIERIYQSTPTEMLK